MARLFTVAAAMLAVGVSSATAQGTGADSAGEAPRFLRVATGASREAEVIDPAGNPVLSHRIAINLHDVSRGAAVREIALSSGLQFVYAGDVLPRAGVVRVQSDNITVAAALTKVLFGAGVDVVMAANGSVILRKKPQVENATAGAAAARATQRAVELAPITTIAIAESRRTFETQPTMGHLDLDTRDLAVIAGAGRGRPVPHGPAPARRRDAQRLLRRPQRARRRVRPEPDPPRRISDL